MASRLGPDVYLALKRRELSPAEVRELYLGGRWRRSRETETVANAVIWLMTTTCTNPPDLDQILKTFRDYDMDYQKSLGIDKRQPMPWDRKKRA